MRLRRLLVAVAVMFLASSFVGAAIGQASDLTEFQKETISSIREITLQLILIAIGVFALLGSFATGERRTFKAKGLLWISFTLLGVSVMAGLLGYGTLIWILGKGTFDPFGTIAGLASAQWLSFGSGGLLFGLFVAVNIKRSR